MDGVETQHPAAPTEKGMLRPLAERLGRTGAAQEQVDREATPAGRLADMSMAIELRALAPTRAARWWPVLPLSLR